MLEKIGFSEVNKTRPRCSVTITHFGLVWNLEKQIHIVILNHASAAFVLCVCPDFIVTIIDIVGHLKQPV